MSFTPYDWEREERRDSEWFANPSVYDDGPDPSEYMEYEENNEDEFDEDEFDAIEAEYAERFPKPGMIDPNAPLKGMLGILIAMLLGLMFWITFGVALLKWLP